MLDSYLINSNSTQRGSFKLEYNETDSSIFLFSKAHQCFSASIFIRHSISLKKRIGVQGNKFVGYEHKIGTFDAESNRKNRCTSNRFN